jgi:hypothetical protein
MIPMIDADFPPLGSNSVHLSPNLPPFQESALATTFKVVAYSPAAQGRLRREWGPQFQC